MQVTLEMIYYELQKLRREIKEIKWMLIPEDEPDEAEKEDIEKFLQD